MIGSTSCLLSLYIIPQNAEPAVNIDTALATRASAESRATDSESTRQIQSQPTGANCRAENLDTTLPLTSLPLCISNRPVESVEFTNNSSLASEQRVSRAAVLMLRVVEIREEEQENEEKEKGSKEK